MSACRTSFFLRITLPVVSTKQTATQSFVLHRLQQSGKNEKTPLINCIYSH